MDSGSLTFRPSLAIRRAIGRAIRCGGDRRLQRQNGAGNLHSEALRVTDRFRRRDFGHLDWEMTFDDPKMYTKPFTIKIPHELVPDNDIFEMFCENEKDRPHLRKN